MDIYLSVSPGDQELGPSSNLETIVFFFFGEYIEGAVGGEEDCEKKKAFSVLKMIKFQFIIS